MFSFLVALSLYLALSPARPALSFDALQPRPSASLKPAAAREMPLPAAPRKKDETRLGVETTAKAATVIDWTTGAPLFEKGSDEPLPLASITKLITALIVVERSRDWDAPVEVIASDERGGDVPIIVPGDKVTIRNLFNLSLIASSNDATAALARSTGLTDEQFAAEMNRVAKSIGMAHATFVEPTGLDPRNVASARDVALLVRKAIETPIVRDTVGNREFTFAPIGGGSRRVRSTDYLLDSFLNRPPYTFLGGKTGFIDEAGYCFAAATENSDGNRVVAVVLGAASKDERFAVVKNLTYWAFDAYQWTAKTTAK